MLRSERVWTLNLRLDSLIGGIAYKNGYPDFAGCPVAMRQAQGLCYSLRGLDTESAIRLFSQKDSIQKTGTLTLQDARLTCGKRMTYAAV